MLRLCLLLLPVALAACAASSAVDGRSGVDRGRLLDFLKSRGISYDEQAAGDGSLLIVPAWGARVVGAFFDGDNVFWTPPDFDPADPKARWNKGGYRTWIAPEGHDKGFFFDKTWDPDKWDCPAAIDPGAYRAAEAMHPGCRAYANELRVTSNDGTEYHLRVTREIGTRPNPLADHPAARGVKSIDILFAHRLKNLSDRAIDKEIGLWSLIMVKPGGTMIVPVQAGVEGSPYRDNYFERVPPGWITHHPASAGIGAKPPARPRDPFTRNGPFMLGGPLLGMPDALTMRVNGPPRYKIGVSAARCLGITGSIAALPDGSWQVIVKRFPWDPRAAYADRPKDEATSNGDAIQGYNHKEGGAMAFYELECHSPAYALGPGEEREHPIEVLIYRGPERQIKRIGSILFGVEVDGLKLY